MAFERCLFWWPTSGKLSVMPMCALFTPRCESFGARFRGLALLFLGVVGCRTPGTAAPNEAGVTNSEAGTIAEQAPLLPQAPEWAEDLGERGIHWQKTVVDHPQRPVADRGLDKVRRPAAMLAFIEPEAGMRIAELGAGGGYTTELVFRATGGDCRYWSQNPPEWQSFVEPLQSRRLADGRLRRVKHSYRSFESPLADAATDLDLVLSVLVYHDIANTMSDRGAMNLAIFERLKPGGRYIVIDHDTEPGVGASASERLHRIEEALVVHEVEAAGFELRRSGTFLANDADPHDFMAFARPIQPVTDRFVLEFVKPE